MIAWSIIWSLMVLSTILLIAMEIVNGTIEIRFWICVLLIFAIIMIPIFVLGAYTQSKNFVYKYEDFLDKVATMNDSQEYMYLGNAIDYNYHLAVYQYRIKQLGIFAPYCREIWQLKPIELRNFDMSKYIWWG